MLFYRAAFDPSRSADKGVCGRARRHRHPLQAEQGPQAGQAQKLANRHHAKARAVGEQGTALKRWHILPQARRSPSRLTSTVQAILTLHHHTSRGRRQLTVGGSARCCLAGRGRAPRGLGIFAAS
jgi:hypothetical protein